MPAFAARKISPLSTRMALTNSWRDHWTEPPTRWFLNLSKK